MDAGGDGGVAIVGVPTVGICGGGVDWKKVISGKFAMLFMEEQSS
jgi:hypothetical protein